jgi:hypothetical protein
VHPKVSLVVDELARTAARLQIEIDQFLGVHVDHGYDVGRNAFTTGVSVQCRYRGPGLRVGTIGLRLDGLVDRPCVERGVLEFAARCGIVHEIGAERLAAMLPRDELMRLFYRLTDAPQGASETPP